MSKNHLKHDYIQLGDAPLGDFGLHVATEMEGSASFTDPPVKPAELKTAANTFNAAVAACSDGTKEDTIHKNALRDALIALLDQLVTYVELTAKNDPEVMASSGFNLASTAAVKPSPVGAVAIVSVTNSGTGNLQLGLNMGPNVWGIEAQVSTAPNAWVAAGYFTDPRNVTLTSLSPGTMYGIRARVHGSLNQVSSWSDPVNHMAT